MKNTVLISAIYSVEGPAGSPFEVFFRNMASGLNKNSGETGWAAQIIGKAGVRAAVPGCGDVFSPPPSMSAGKKMRAALDGFKRKLGHEKFISDYSAKLREYADTLASAEVIHSHDVQALLALKKAGLGGAAALCFTPGALSRFARGAGAPAWLAEEERAALVAADLSWRPAGLYQDA